MPLREHLSEFRRRLVISGIAILLGAVVGWYLYSPLFQAIQEPLSAVAKQAGITASPTYKDVMQAFNLHFQTAVLLGFVVASPVWLYQTWAFILPGLTKREKWHAIGFSAVGVPLFLAGIYVGWRVFPNAISFFVLFAENGTSLLPDAGTYIGFVTRLVLVFGLAFLLPLFLVALNMAGLVKGRTLAKGWRLAVFVIFVFGAIASPTPDAGSLLALALPMCLLYGLAVGISLMIDRRRERRGGTYGHLSDDEASPLEDTTPIETSAPLAGSAHGSAAEHADHHRASDDADADQATSKATSSANRYSDLL